MNTWNPDQYRSLEMFASPSEIAQAVVQQLKVRLLDRLVVVGRSQTLLEEARALVVKEAAPGFFEEGPSTHRNRLYLTRSPRVHREPAVLFVTPGASLVGFRFDFVIVAAPVSSPDLDTWEEYLLQRMQPRRPEPA